MSNNLQHNKKEFIHGSIYKITLKNFMTYSNVEFFPGQSLNLIIGPNGSGKSSIIYAIILGLGGDLKDIGYEKNISYFIKKETSHAKIEIELYRKGKQKMIITTTLNKSNKKFLYQIDHVTKTKEELLNCMKDMSIQVSNLCQVLPQGKFQSFSSLNRQKLLENTISAVSGRKAVELRNKLINEYTKLKKYELENQISERNIKELQNQNTRFELKVKVAKEQMRLRKEEELCKMKEKWIQYKNLEVEVKQYKENMQSASEDIKKLEDEKEKKKNDIDKEVKHRKGRLDFIKKVINDLKEKINNSRNVIRSGERKVKHIEESLKLKEEKNLERKIENDILNKKRLDLSNCLNVDEDESSFQKQLKQQNEKINGLHKERNELETKILSTEEDKESIRKSIHTYTEQLEKLKNKDQTKKLLKDKYEHTYKALEWLEDNRHLFQHQVYKPMLLEIDFDNEDDAKFLENTVSDRDLTSFCFEDSQDMENFLRIVRSKLGFKLVNACTLSSETNLRQPPAIDSIMQYGFSRYLRDTFRAPPAVARHLCARHAVHRVPLGDARAATAPTAIPLHFTDKHRVSVKQSKYSGLYTKYSTFIRPAELLISYPPQIRCIEEKLNNFVNDQNNMTEQLTIMKSAKDDLNERIKKEKESKDEIKRKIEMLEEIKRLYAKSKIDAVDMEAEKSRARQQQADVTRRLLVKHSELLKEVRRLHAAELYRGKLERCFNAVHQKSAELIEFDVRLDPLKKKKESLISSIDKNERKMNSIRNIIQDSEKKFPNDPDFLYKVEFDVLPESIEELRVKYHEIKRDLKNEEDYSKVVKEHEERENKIKERTKEIEKRKVMIKELNYSIKDERQEWLHDLESLVETINGCFMKMIGIHDYTGEVKLYKDPKEPDDVSRYELHIGVVTRAGQKMQLLDLASLSGGERATATACFLLALQARAAAPFRCLDEINQGMDVKNERTFMKTLTKKSSEEDHCQYFVLSPKLLKNLEYNAAVKVHVIMCGESNVPSNVWEADTFLEKARDYGMNNGDIYE